MTKFLLILILSQSHTYEIARYSTFQSCSQAGAQMLSALKGSDANPYAGYSCTDSQ